jgi:outer membrane immunogenic protein
MWNLSKRILGLALAGVVGCGSANAADMYAAGRGMKDPVYEPVTTWTGFYLGAHLGAAFGTLETTDFNEVAGKFKNDPTDVFGGVQFGYNMQHGHFVYGAEVDLGAMGFNDTVSQPGATYIKSTISTGLYGDITGRLGYAFDRTLVYAKGGFAFFEGDIKITDVGEASTIKSGLTGYTIGAGVEHKFSPAWSVKAEYQYFDFGSETLLVSDDKYTNELTAHTVKVGVNYSFQKDYAPLK